MVSILDHDVENASTENKELKELIEIADIMNKNITSHDEVH
jgi:hypothetical protein